MARKQANNEVQRQAQELLAGLAKRYGTSLAPEGTEEEQLAQFQAMPEQEVKTLADQGNQLARRLVRERVQKQEERGFGILEHLLAVITCKAPEGVRYQLQGHLTHLTRRVCEDLGGQDPMPGEKPLIEAAALAFAHLYMAEFHGAAANGVKEQEFYSRAAERANRRLTSAVKTLATVRRLLRPDAPAVVVNLAQLAESVTNILGLAKPEPPALPAEDGGKWEVV